MSALPRLVAASLLAALVASPVVLDACLFTCHESTEIVASQNEPSCHHADESADVRLVPPAAACGHDHSPPPSTTSSSEHRIPEPRVLYPTWAVETCVSNELASSLALVSVRAMGDPNLATTILSTAPIPQRV